MLPCAQAIHSLKNVHILFVPFQLCVVLTPACATSPIMRILMASGFVWKPQKTRWITRLGQRMVSLCMTGGVTLYFYRVDLWFFSPCCRFLPDNQECTKGSAAHSRVHCGHSALCTFLVSLPHAAPLFAVVLWNDCCWLLSMSAGTGFPEGLQTSWPCMRWTEGGLVMLFGAHLDFPPHVGKSRRSLSLPLKASM